MTFIISPGYDLSTVYLAGCDTELGSAVPLSAEGLKQICQFLNYDTETQNTKELAVVAFVYLFSMLRGSYEYVPLLNLVFMYL